MSCCSSSCTSTGQAAIGIISGLSGIAAPWYNSVAFRTPVIAGPPGPSTVQQAASVASVNNPFFYSLTQIFPLLFVGLIIGGIILLVRESK